MSPARLELEPYHSSLLVRYGHPLTINPSPTTTPLLNPNPDKDPNIDVDSNTSTTVTQPRCSHVLVGKSFCCLYSILISARTGSRMREMEMCGGCVLGVGRGMTLSKAVTRARTSRGGCKRFFDIR